MRHLKALIALAAISIIWTWPLVLHVRDHLPGPGGANYTYLWNLWWMRKALSAPELAFFRSNYLFAPFGIDLITQSHAALQGYVSATLLGGLTVTEAANLYIIGSVFLNAVCAYVLAFDLVRERRVALLAAVAFGGSPYVAARLTGQFDLLTAWVIPLFALCLRRAIRTGRLAPAAGAGTCVAVAAYSAPDYVVYLAVFAIAYTVAGWRLRRPTADVFWRGMQALMIATAVAAVLASPLIAQAARIAGRYDTQVAFLRTTPRGVDLLAPFLGNPFHPLYGSASSRLYEDLGIDPVETVKWIGIVPLVVLLRWRGKWADTEEARRWKVALILFAVWALWPAIPGRAMVMVYLSLGVLMALRLAQGVSVRYAFALIVLLAVDYLHAPIPLTALDRPAVYEQLATIDNTGAVIEVPFGVGRQQRRLLYYATIHGHPLVGGYVDRIPPIVAQAYAAMPVVGNLLRLSAGREALDEDLPPGLPFRYLVLDTAAAPPELVDYVRATLDMDLIVSGGGRQLYAVQGVRPPSLRATR